MKTTLRLLSFLAAGLALVSAGRTFAATTPDPVIAAVTAADAERQAAFVAGDRAQLDAILSDSLRYAHSNGKIDTKATLIESIVSGRSDYESFDYREREFVPAGPGVVLMPGRVVVGLRTAGGPMTLDLNFLGVWREENGKWRFFAWQSSKNPPEPAK
ncbi:nuclear transport factor 2 family protein [Opitutus terrae]|uniref:DUF4440 domain-containing protein n=1 Tax=Opitutus terrae (strain DSM 11246 / JCM 15787 / PB90-1) TaxID=452637 RepID=B1ZQQ6_OPITP|nr:nuclear transport factor 2 family protein [Opitutus terrae]ACB77807.1 hypothetical protein Oter_4536 [Opitutus terrae PB90-1]